MNMNMNDDPMNINVLDRNDDNSDNSTKRRNDINYNIDKNIEQKNKNYNIDKNIEQRNENYNIDKNIEQRNEIDVNHYIISGEIEEEKNSNNKKDRVVSLSVKMQVINTTRDNEQVIMSSWRKIVCFNMNCVHIARTLKARDRVLIAGAIKLNKWTDNQTGQVKRNYEIVANSISRLENTNTLVEDINLCCISGVITDKPRIGITNNNNQVISFSIKLSNIIKTTNMGDHDELKTIYSWIKIVSFDQSLINQINTLNSGTKVLVQGLVKINRWTDSTGEVQRAYEVHPSTIHNLDNGNVISSNSVCDNDELSHNDKVSHDSVTDLPDDMFE